MDDSTDVHSIATHILKDNFNIDSAHSPSEAISLSTAKHYDLIFMDMDLGSDIDGIETFRRIRSYNGNIRIPAIAVSSNDAPSVQSRCMTEGFHKFVGKPFLKKELLEAAANALK